MDGHKQAIVLSGGGAYGAYEIGVMKALFQGHCPATGHLCLDPQIFTGTSVGAVNATFMISQPETDLVSTIEQLESIWINRFAENSNNCGNGVFRFRGNPIEFFDPNCVLRHPLTPVTQVLDDSVFFTRDLLARSADFVFSTQSLQLRTIGLFNVADLVSIEPLQSTVASIVNLEGVRRSQRFLVVAATHWDNGRLALFTNKDLTDAFGHQILMASAAIPGIFPPARVGGHVFVDGGVIMNTPLLPAIRAGADVIHVVYLDPNVADIPLQRLQNTIDTFDRLTVIQWAAKANEDIETVRWVNMGIAALQKAAVTSEKQARDILRVLGPLQEKMTEGKSYRHITVHRYHPREDLGGPLGMLNFARSQIEGLIQKGFEDAINHNCDESECILPEPMISQEPSMAAPS